MNWHLWRFVDIWGHLRTFVGIKGHFWKFWMSKDILDICRHFQTCQMSIIKSKEFCQSYSSFLGLRLKFTATVTIWSGTCRAFTVSVCGKLLSSFCKVWIPARLDENSSGILSHLILHFGRSYLFWWRPGASASLQVARGRAEQR